VSAYPHRVTVRRVIGACLAALSLSLALLGPSALAAGAYVDGISDQSIPTWDGGFHGSYFAGLFRDVWVGGQASHITFARYVVQWNAMSGDYPRYRSEFEAWLTDVASLDLHPEIALTSYDGVYPGSSSEYRLQLEQILARARAIGHPIGYLEAWNEPNNQGREPAVNAAGFTNAASATCQQEYACTVVAGNFEDSADVAAYEQEYIDNLDPVPTIWGVHPYNSIEQQSEAPFLNFREHLPGKGAGDQIWFTEIAARECSDFNGQLVENGEAGQARRASWLVNTLMGNAKPEHVFYYEFLLKEHRRPSCQVEGSDSALYLPANDPAEPDRPRLAASYIWDGESEPLGYLAGAFMANPAQRALTGAVGL
jgi:hypothetical protein